MTTNPETASDKSANKTVSIRKPGKESGHSPRPHERGLWVAAMNDQDNDWEETLEERPEAAAELGSRILDIQQEALPFGQDLLMQAKRTPYLGTAMAGLETSGYIRESITLGQDIYHGGAWTVSKVLGLFGR